MVKRTDIQPDKIFEVEFRNLLKETEDLKNAQNFGRDVGVPHIVECLDIFGNPTPYDVVALDDGFGGLFANFNASFVADHQEECYAIPQFKYLKQGLVPPTTANNVGGFCYIDVNNADIPYQIGYTGYISVDTFYGATELYLKVYFYATDTGVLTVTQS